MILLIVTNNIDHNLKETMTGYNCIRWDLYDPELGTDHNTFLKDNYLSLSNKEMGERLNRTPDAVRKQLNALKLRRPKKTDIAKKKKKAEKEFFANLKMEKDHKKELDRIRKDMIRKERKKRKEKEWFQKQAQAPKQVLSEPEHKSKRVSVRIDHRTIIQCPEHKVSEILIKYGSKAIPK